MRPIFWAVLSVSLLLIAWGAANGGPLHVPSEYPTIQAGLDGAAVGDTVLVAPGTYTGPGNRDLDFGGKDLVLQSEEGPEQTIIDCQGSWDDPHRGFYFHSGETAQARLEGFTVRGGSTGEAVSGPPSPDDFGGGVYARTSSPTISHCVIEDCAAADEGGGIYYVGGGSAILDCMVRDNYSGSFAGGMSLSGSDMTFSGCQFIDNYAVDAGGGIVAPWWYDIEMTDCVISGNQSTYGGGFLILGTTDFRMTNCLITGNLALELGGGFLFEYAEEPVTLAHCTITSNYASWGGGIEMHFSTMRLEETIISGNCTLGSGREIYLLGPAEECHVTLSCCASTPGGIDGAGQSYEGPSIWVDPGLCAPASCDDAPTSAGNYTLQHDSVCLPGNNPCEVLIGALGDGCGPSSVPGGAVPSPAARISPNPSAGPVHIDFDWPAVGSVTVQILDVGGRVVRELFDGPYPAVYAGNFDLTWDGRDRQGKEVPSGVYWTRITTAGGDRTVRLVRVR